MLIPDYEQSYNVRPAHALREYESIQHSGRSLGVVTRAETHIHTERLFDPVVLLLQT